MKRADLKAMIAATDAATAILRKQFGEECAVIVALGTLDGFDHSAYTYTMHGRCLPLEGLLVRVHGDIQRKLWRRAWDVKGHRKRATSTTIHRGKQ
jgi:hypothetical protein